MKNRIRPTRCPKPPSKFPSQPSSSPNHVILRFYQPGSRLLECPAVHPPTHYANLIMARKLRIAVSVFFAVLLCFPLGLVWRGGASGMPLVLLLLVAALVAVPWIPYSRRFSLRTLLIATTLVAVVLGLAVWAGR